MHSGVPALVADWTRVNQVRVRPLRRFLIYYVSMVHYHCSPLRFECFFAEGPPAVQTQKAMRLRPPEVEALVHRLELARETLDTESDLAWCVSPLLVLAYSNCAMPQFTVETF